MAFKHFIRDSWLTGSYYTGMSQLYAMLMGRKRGIITYHNTLPVGSLPKQDAYNVDVTVDVFDRQLAFLKKHFNVLPIQELENEKAKGFFLTVDDGMLNNHDYLVPMLEKYDLTALFGVCPAFIDGELPHIWRDFLFLIFRKFVGQPILLPINAYQEPYIFKSVNEGHGLMRKYVYENKIADVYAMLIEICEKNNLPFQKMNEEPQRFEFMNWEQIGAITKKGNRIASHTMSHRILKFLSDEEKRYELGESKKRIESQLDTNIDILIYPYGGPEQIDQSTLKIAEEVGYKLALMNVQNPNLEPINWHCPVLLSLQLTMCHICTPLCRAISFYFKTTTNMYHCYLNGDIMPTENASLKLNDLSLLRGYGMFDYFRTYNGQPFKWDWYWQRFEKSASMLKLDLPLSQSQTADVLVELYKRSQQAEVAFRFILTGGYSPDSVSVVKPNLAILCEKLPNDNPQGYEKGIKVLPYEFVRDMPEVKTTNYLHMLRLANEMKSQNASDLLYFKDGEVSELTRSNFFIFKGDTLITSDRNILHGITRRVVLELAEQHFKIEVRPLLYSELAHADEAFTTSTTKWVMPIVQIGRELVGDGSVGGRSKKLLEMFRQYVGQV